MNDGRWHLGRRILGLSWLAAWCAVLYAVAAPWRDLGGFVQEQLRWLEWFVLMAALSTGFTVGRLGRMSAGRRGAPGHHGFLRWLLYPIAGVTAGALVALRWWGLDAPIGIAVTGFLAYWAGLDFGFAAVPLLDGEPYRFEEAPAPSRWVRAAARARTASGWLPPWDRY